MTNMTDEYSPGFIHDLVNHVTVATLSLDDMERRLTHNSNMLREYAIESARARKSIERFARSVQDFMKKGNVCSFLHIRREVKSALEVFSAQIKKNNVRVSVDIKERLTLCGNRLKFNQIISNLISNALDALTTSKNQKEERYTGEKFIRIACTETKQKGQFTLTVSDNGCGISKEHVDKIWEPLFTTKGRRGSGIGLASVKKIVHADFRGSIGVKSQPGKTTTVTVILRNAL